MSLSSLLLGKTKEVDNDLDSLFKSAAKPVSLPAVTLPSASTSKLQDNQKKRKSDSKPPSSSAKRVKSSQVPPSEEQRPVQLKKQKKDKASVADKSQTKGKGKPKIEEDSDEDEDNSDIENQYLAGKSSKSKALKQQNNSDRDDNDEGDDSSESEDGEPLVHESLKKQQKKSSRTTKKKYIPSDETPEQRDQRTIFVGNLPIAVAQKRPLQKQLRSHFLNLVPTAKIESIRYRSVPFQAPTAKLPTSDNEGDDKSPAKQHQQQQKPRQHELDRANTWRSKQDDDEAAAKNDEKKFLNSAQKKKIAFINHEFHSTADVTNAYVVFAHPPADLGSRPANLPPPPPTLDPYEAARLAVERCNNTLFMERLIRVDRVGKAGKGRPLATTDGAPAAATAVGALLDADPKLSVFVGNLDFASKEEDLRLFFEGVITTTVERGAPEGVDGGLVQKPKTWVTHVRIVRDKDTQLGKGFAYVQFADKECVDEVLALEEGKIKFAKRKLRVQRCKSMPGSSLKINTTSSAAKPSKSKQSGGPAPANKPARPATPIVVPKGDPTLGDRLAHLPKDARKQAKATDADRVARRLAKKKARMALAPPGSRSEAGKERDRVRKSAVKERGKANVNPGKKVGKGRVRSDKSAAKRNAKK